MANEIKSVEDARQRLRELFAPSETDDLKKMRLRDEDDLEDFARIAYFLTRNKEVIKALEIVSAGIWACYRETSVEQSPNRFSQAIITYAARNFGFVAQGNVVFIGPLGGREFLTYVRSGVLWKDTFAPGHGEFSHSLQWLAAGVALNLGTRTAELYKKAGSIFSNRPLYSRDTETDLMGHAVQPLWAWLVDSFSPSQGVESEKAEGIDHVFSKASCRVPNAIPTLTRQRKWFITLYLDHRRDWLKALAEKGKQMRQQANETDDPDSNLLGIVKYQKSKYPVDPKWETKQGSGNVLRKITVDNTDKNQVPMQFHGQWGNVSMKAFELKTMIS
jgi:hypothetical protein